MKQSTFLNDVFSHTRRTRFLLPLSFACFLTSACGMATFDGEADLLQLQVIHPDDTIASSIGAVLAEGTQVQMRAIIKDGKLPGKISDATSSDKTTLNIASFDQNHVVLDALKAGTSDIALKVKNADSEVLEDVIPLEVRKVASTVVTHPCKDAVFLTNGTIDMPYSMRDENDKRLTGYGFYPFSFEPTGPQIDQDYQFVAHIRTQTGSKPGSYALQSTLPTSNLELTVIEPSEVTKFTDINYDADADPTVLALDSGPSPVANFVIEASEKPVCGNSDHIAVSSLTPEICSGQMKALGTLYFLTVSPLQAGACILDVQLLDADKTVLKSQQATVSITS